MRPKPAHTACIEMLTVVSTFLHPVSSWQMEDSEYYIFISPQLQLGRIQKLKSSWIHEVPWGMGCLSYSHTVSPSAHSLEYAESCLRPLRSSSNWGLQIAAPGRTEAVATKVGYIPWPQTLSSKAI